MGLLGVGRSACFGIPGVAIFLCALVPHRTVRLNSLFRNRRMQYVRTAVVLCLAIDGKVNGLVRGWMGCEWAKRWVCAWVRATEGYSLVAVSGFELRSRWRPRYPWGTYMV